VPDDGPHDRADISDDITRIVSYLNTKRAGSQDRTVGLVHEISHRREEVVNELGSSANHALADRFSSLAQSLPERNDTTNETAGNPALTERYHSFCRELDVLLDSFRARIDINKPVKH
jgi:hypothetical protein